MSDLRKQASPDLTSREPTDLLRVDAERNRAAIVLAAREAFAEEGPDVALERIAERAGLTRTTVRRRFADREALMLAIMDEDTREIEALADRLGDAPDALDALLAAIVRQQARHRGLYHAAIGMGLTAAPRSDAARRFSAASAASATRAHALFGRALTAAQQAGCVRAGVDVLDLMLAVLMLGAAVDHGHLGDPLSCGERGLEIVLDGLRP